MFSYLEFVLKENQQIRLQLKMRIKNLHINSTLHLINLLEYNNLIKTFEILTIFFNEHFFNGTHIVLMKHTTNFDRQRTDVGIVMLLQSLDVPQTIEFLNCFGNILDGCVLTKRNQNLTQCAECVLKCNQDCVGSGLQKLKIHFHATIGIGVLQ